MKLSERGAKAQFARRISVALGTTVDLPKVSRWCSGERNPSAEERAFIEDDLGVFWRDWDVSLTNDSAPDPEAA
jgi:transcriptional regulator with XRE-family HTH domain